MNNYHIYEEIGRGKFSVVYKVTLIPRITTNYLSLFFRIFSRIQGRKKKSIEHVAVKSLEKTRRKKVLNEVI